MEQLYKTIEANVNYSERPSKKSMDNYYQKLLNDMQQNNINELFNTDLFRNHFDSYISKNPDPEFLLKQIKVNEQVQELLKLPSFIDNAKELSKALCEIAYTGTQLSIENQKAIWIKIIDDHLDEDKTTIDFTKKAFIYVYENNIPGLSMDVFNHIIAEFKEQKVRKAPKL
jgi:hypothetical protein